MAILSEFEIWMFLAGLGIFLFGMHMMEESIRLLSGTAFKSLIKKYTGTRPKAVLSGIFSTAILQSSSAVSLMVLAFLGAGMMNLVQAVAVMMGTKIGTTATAWVVALFGFEFNIDAFSLPLIGIGGLGLIFLSKSSRYVNISKFLVAFGFLFMGLDYMKQSVDQFSGLINPEALAGYGILVFALAGVVLTAIMQSSSATIAIVLTMLFSGVIQFEAGAAMVVGANVGTTVTVLLGSVGGIPTKKQAAVCQLIFTVGAAVLTLLLLPLYVWIVLEPFGFGQNLVLGLAFFHTLFNLAGVAVFYPLIPLLARKAESWIPEREVQLSHYIHKTDPEISEAGLEAFRKEIIWQLQYSLDYIEQVARTGRNGNQYSYMDLEKYHAEIFEYFTRLHQYEMREDVTAMLDELLRASRNIMNAVLNIREAADELQILRGEAGEIHKAAYRSLEERLVMAAACGRSIPKADTEEQILQAEESVELLYQKINCMDKEYLSAVRSAVGNPAFGKGEITFSLMLNRIVTQSCRMLVYSMKSLLKHEYISKKDIPGG